MKKLNIIYEDKYLLVVNKPCKLLTISNGKENVKTLYSDVYDYLHKKNQKIFVVHRLDRDTSGLVMFAKSENVKNIMQDNWAKVVRKYYAVVEGVVRSNGKVESYLKETKTFLTYSTHDKSGKFAQTFYKPICNNKKYSLLDISITTGRKNQIRVHMQDIKHSLIGDRKYGSSLNPINRLGLHAYYLEFKHPINNENIVLMTQIPKEFERVVKYS